MKHIIFSFVMILGLITSLHAAKLDKVHSTAGFSIKYLLVSHLDGQFTDYDASVELDGTNIKSFEASAKIASVATQNKKRDTHLQADDYFGAKEFPTIDIKMISMDGNKMLADVTIRGTTRQVAFNVEVATAVSKGKKFAGVTLTGPLNRKDFNVGNKYPNAAISEEVNVSISLKFDDV